MSNHFSDIGFRITEENFETEIKKIIDGNIKNAGVIDRGGMPYLVIPVDGLIELWFPFRNSTVDPYTVSLHYRSETFIEVENAEWKESEGGGNEGLLSVLHRDFYPFNVTVPAPGLAPDFEKGRKYNCQTACFADDLSVYEDAGDFHKRSSLGKDFSENMFLPTGTFDISGNGGLTSEAMISGTVKSVEKRINGFTGLEYYVIKAETYGGCCELLADPELLPRGISEGNIVCGNFWLSGRLLDIFRGQELSDLRRRKKGDPHIETLGDLCRVLRHCWSAETAYPSCQKEWSRRDRTYGQCAVTAMLVCDMFGGTIHKTRQYGSSHYFNRINGKYADLTSEQFDLFYLPVDYEKNTEVDRSYCGRNPDTKKRYQLLIRNISEYLKTLE